MNKFRASHPSFWTFEGRELMLQALDSTPLSFLRPEEPALSPVIVVQVACYHQGFASLHTCWSFMKAGACAGGGNNSQEEDSPQGAFLPHTMLFSSNPNQSDRVQGSSVALPDPGSSFQSWPQLPFPSAFRSSDRPVCSSCIFLKGHMVLCKAPEASDRQGNILFEGLPFPRNNPSGFVCQGSIYMKARC